MLRGGGLKNLPVVEDAYSADYVAGYEKLKKLR